MSLTVELKYLGVVAGLGCGVCIGLLLKRKFHGIRRLPQPCAGAQSMVDLITNGWFSEVNSLWPGQSMSLQVEKLLFHKRSQYQDVLVFKSVTYGVVLVLDGVIQCTQRDEFSYQEMLAHLPLCSHPNPKQVLIIGGGDGGVAREVVKLAAVETVTICEIDEMVVNVAKQFLPQMAKGFESPKLNLHIGDGFEFMKKHQGEFDVIITDSSDPVGPAESLFQKQYYSLMKGALKDNGVLCSQGECFWIDLKLIKNMRTFCKELFPVVEYATMSIPTYPCGQIGAVLCSKSPDISFRDPVRKLSEEEVKHMDLNYYNHDVHRASFILPQFVKQALD
ncbi:PREDICTED: spermidine synthase-like [Priapulus caudatus]|uniref:Spermidine synthase-like n=1 Tax=Priapulus caudatus TaxID=37621 RepID=A0ABM1F942_PRICU|nr:PREDICTED: spermidine synthase-like [Priapulus caudatus]